MTCAQLFRLQDQTGPFPDYRFYQLGAMTDHHHIITATGRFSGIQDMFHHGAAPHLMQYLR